MSITTAAGSDPLTAGLSAVPVQHEDKTVSPLKFADIGINLSDPIFQGVYHGKKAHDNDLPQIVERALGAGCRKLMVTGSDLEESQKAIDLAEQYPGLCYATVGVHPCSAMTFEKYAEGPDALLSALRDLAIKTKAAGTAAAYGEFGLDYDRLHYADKDTQIKYFRKQLDIAVEVQLPLFLHSRAAAEDFEAILKERLDELPKRGCVHSFTGTLEEMKRLVDMGFDVGINGCSLKTEENVDVVREVPLERLQIETDGPWCEMRPSHASAKYLKDAPQLPKAVKKEKWTADNMVKGRNEPCTIPNVAYAIANIKGISVEEVCEAAWNNSIKMFGLGEK
ncbi:hydrolase, TatD family protein [Aureobasidium pullulans]|uniref:Hydrolase, TatD family protein n=1 Tax=Aureobasidium pullulans TaxID=5580 RepID=A0A4V4IWD4_AURPU|nr:hydrolase, TatD family protein [Aureobasidium pullulans]THZ24955.1 hydrolase, TatD family protein [Aureobasidium pullulans]